MLGPVTEPFWPSGDQAYRPLAEDLGWTPRFDLAASCDDFISWLETHHDR